MLVVESSSPEQTGKFGKQIAKVLQPGDVLCLQGGLGAGKTCFVQGVAEGMDCVEQASSPTYTILQAYQGRLALYHFDVYRLDQPWELEDIGFYEYVYGRGVSIIEWAEKFTGELPEERLWITIDKLNDTGRKITLHPHGKRYEQLLEDIANENTGH